MKKQSLKFPIRDIDLRKVNPANDFRDFPAIFQTPDDIKEFIEERQLDLPVLSNLLKLRKLKQLNFTQIEDQFYFAELFDYIYDVYRVPIEDTYVKTAEWLSGIERSLVYGGVSHMVRHAYEFAMNRYQSKLDVEKFMADFYKEHKVERQNQEDLINYHTDIGEANEFYHRPQANVLESFWIKTDSCSGQPLRKGDDYYMRVHVYPERVYIFGCDDTSYTLETKNQKEAQDFAKLLKTAAPTWDFNYAKLIHPQLEFTN